jgi:hypothetical protein
MLDPLTRVPQMMDGPDCIGESRIAISLCTNLLSPGTPIPDLRLFGILYHVSLVSTAHDGIGILHIAVL